MDTAGEGPAVDDAALETAHVQLGSLLAKCEAVMRGTSLTPSRRTLMDRRVAALRTALHLVDEARSRGGQASHPPRLHEP